MDTRNLRIKVGLYLTRDSFDSKERDMSGNQAIGARLLFYMVYVCIGIMCAINGCGLLTRSPEHSIEEYILMLEDPDSNVRLDATEGLRLRGAAAIAAVDALVVACEDEDGSVRYGAVSALGQISHDRRVVEALFNRISFDDWRPVRWHAQGVLVDVIGVDAKYSVDLVINAVKSDNKHVRITAILLLGKIGPEPGVVTALSECLESIKWDDSGISAMHRKAIVTSLVEMGCAASSAIPILEEIGEIYQ